MGGSSSKIEQDKALQLCRERKKFVRQALDGRCSLAAAHVAYIHSLKNTGTALTNFLQHSTTATTETTSSAGVQIALTETKSLSHFSASSHSPPPSSVPSTRFHSNHMKFTNSTPSVNVVHKPSHDDDTSSHFHLPPPPDDDTPWDYFSLFPPAPVDDDSNIPHFQQDQQDQQHHHIDDHHSFSTMDQDFHDSISDDEFDEPSTNTLVRSFKNLNSDSHIALEDNPSPCMPSARSLPSEPEILNADKTNSPSLSPLKSTSSFAAPNDFERGSAEAASTGNKIDDAKDFFSSIKDIEHLFIKASDSGKEVPRMLEANKLHFRPMVPGKQGGSMTYTFFNVCFSCGEDPTRVPEEPVQAGVSYLTWHRTTSSHSSSSRNPLTSDSRDDTEGFISNYCMISGSHASTLDRLYAWERKLYDEIKASEMIRREYDMKCKILRQHESKGEAPHKADKFRAVVKDLHSRIRVAIHRIDSISKRIEELRDKELQPQLEELIEGLSRMWEVMLECHKLQFEIISKACCNSKTEISLRSESHRQYTVQLENEVRYLSSSFSRWIGAQRSYVQAIDGWLSKCVSLPKRTSRRMRRDEGSSWRRFGPPIYVACGEWLQMLDKMPAKDVVDSMKSLASETTRFLPSQEKKHGKSLNISGDEASEAWIAGADRFQSNLADFIGQLNKFAECSVELYKKLEEDIKDSKNKYEHMKARS